MPMTKKHNALNVPYRLETIEDITSALHSDLLSGVDYKRLLHFAKEKSMQQPDALIRAKKKVTRKFSKVDEGKIRESKITFYEVANLPLVAEYPLLRESIPWIDDIVRHKDLFDFFYSFPGEIRERLQMENITESLTSMYAAVLAVRRLLKRDLLVYIKARKTSMLNLVQLKQSLVALTVFDPANEDIILALRTEKTDGAGPLHQNALAEILFARLPQTISRLLTSHVESMIRKLSAKISRINLSSRHMMNLMGYIRTNITIDDFYKALGRIDGVAAKMLIPQESKNKLHHYIESLKKNIDRAPSVYRALFLSPGLETYQKLYKPTRVMKQEETVTVHTRLFILDFYATKDYFDLIKARFSSDCTATYLGEKQLMTPFFFNIRIFSGEMWIGNIYMLDFCEQHGSLIIDRIQIPREMDASFQQFFDHLKEVLIEMFEHVPYQDILMPLKISNHNTVQKIFNQYKKKLKKKEVSIGKAFADRFESLYREKPYYILHKRP